jgi:hypothetical protein
MTNIEYKKRRAHIYQHPLIRTFIQISTYCHRKFLHSNNQLNNNTEQTTVCLCNYNILNLHNSNPQGTILNILPRIIELNTNDHRLRRDD